MDTPRRIKTLQGVVIVIAAIVLLRLFYIQVLDGSYKTNADNNVLRYMVQYPPRAKFTTETDASWYRAKRLTT